MSDITGVVAGMSHMRIVIHEGNDGIVPGAPEGHVTTWGEFCIDNADTIDMLWECRRALVEYGRYVGGGGAAPVFTVSRVATATTLERLTELADGWRVNLSHNGTDWTLTLTAKVQRGDRGAFVYMSTDLSRLINHAWAGAPEGRV